MPQTGEAAWEEDFNEIVTDTTGRGEPSSGLAPRWERGWACDRPAPEPNERGLGIRLAQVERCASTGLLFLNGPLTFICSTTSTRNGAEHETRANRSARLGTGRWRD